MEQNISLYILFSIDKQVYAVQNEIDAEYPRNIRKVRDGSIAKILNLFEHVAVSRIKDKKKTARPWVFDMFL